MSQTSYDVMIIGAGISGISAGLFTSRQGMDTAILDAGDSMITMNAHLENYPGFPDGINPRLLIDLYREQARNHGCEFIQEKVDDVDQSPKGGYVISKSETEQFDYHSDYLICATGNNADYLEEINVEIERDEHGSSVVSDATGRTDLEGLYVTGGLAGKPLQVVISAGHGAEVALAVLNEEGIEFAHDWTVPEGFFTDRDGDIPPGCEEITEEQRSERENRSMERMKKAFDSLHPDDPNMPI